MRACFKSQCLKFAPFPSYQSQKVMVRVLGIEIWDLFGIRDLGFLASIWL
jgi:hypothetical protein